MKCISSKVFVKNDKYIKDVNSLVEHGSDDVDSCTRLNTPAVMGMITRQRLKNRNLSSCYGSYSDGNVVTTRMKQKRAFQEISSKPKRLRLAR